MKLEIPIKVDLDGIDKLIEELKALQTYKLSEDDEMILVNLDDVAEVFMNHIVTINDVSDDVKVTNRNDKEMIYRDDAIDAMTNTLWHYPNECYRNLNEYEFAKGLAELGLKSVPPAQPEVLACGEGELIAQPEIIRCKDCENWDTTWQNDFPPNYHYCPLIDGPRPGDWYCADAERRTDE